MKRRDALRIGGTVLLSSSLFPLLQSCKEEARLTWKPSFLSTDHALLIAALVDTILPKTDTPGGLDVGVDIFIDKVFDQLYDEAGKQAIIAEMDTFNQKCQTKFDKVFHELDASQRTAILKAEEANSPKFNSGIWGTFVGEQKPVGFYRSLKSTAIWAYCTSEEVGKQVLNYDPIPGDYQACLPLSEVGSVWSL